MSKRQGNISRFTVDYQYQVMKMMLEDTMFSIKIKDYIQPGYFSGQLPWLYGKIVEHVNRYGYPPTISWLEQETMRYSDIVDRNQHLELVQNLAAVRIDYASNQHKSIRDHIKRFIEVNTVVENMKDIADEYNNGDFDEVLVKVDRLHKRLTAINLGEDNLISIKDYRQIVALNSSSYARACWFGVDAIDRSLGTEKYGGLLPQTWTTYIGASNSGKSMMSPTIAYVNAKRGKNVYITVHEDEKYPTLNRFLASFSGVPLSRLNIHPDAFSEDEKAALIEAQELLDKHVRIEFMYGKDATVERVCQRLREVKMEWNFDLYICDYGQCLTSTAFKSMDETYHIMGHVYEQLKQICCELDIAGCGGAQANRSANLMNKKGTDFLRTTDISDCFTIIKKSSNVITINRSDSAVANNRIVLLLDKARQGRCPVAVECVSDYSRARSFYTPGRHTYVAAETHELQVGQYDQREINVSEGLNGKKEGER